MRTQSTPNSGGENRDRRPEPEAAAEAVIDPEKKRDIELLVHLAEAGVGGNEGMGQPLERDANRHKEKAKKYAEAVYDKAKEAGYEIPDPAEVFAYTPAERALITATLPLASRLFEEEGVHSALKVANILVDYIFQQPPWAESKIDIELNPERFRELAKVIILICLLNQQVDEGTNVDTTPEVGPKLDLAGWTRETLESYQALAGEYDGVSEASTADASRILADLQSSGMKVPGRWSKCSPEVQATIMKEISNFARANQDVTFRETPEGPIVTFSSEEST